MTSTQVNYIGAKIQTQNMSLIKKIHFHMTLVPGLHHEDQKMTSRIGDVLDINLTQQFG